jgi:hypothetical protein
MSLNQQLIAEFSPQLRDLSIQTLRSVGAGYDIEYRRAKTQGVTGILEASFVLDRSTLQPVAETVTVESGRIYAPHGFRTVPPDRSVSSLASYGDPGFAGRAGHRHQKAFL